MRVRYTKRAAAQIAAALDYVAEQSPQGAERISKRLAALVTLI